MMRFCLTLLIIVLTALTGCSSQTHLSEERSDSPLMSVFETPSVVVPSDLKETVWGNPELLFFRKIATESRADENGWVYQFIYEDYKTDELDNSHIVRYSFLGINLRYRFDDLHTIKVVREISQHKYYEKIAPSIMFFGSANEEEREDTRIISEILDPQKSVDELLSLNPENYCFHVLDKEVFFQLMHEALESEAKEPKDLYSLNKPSYALYQEPAFIDGYKFQLGFVCGMGFVDEIYIDVLYCTDTDNRYVQLSDMVESGRASDEQCILFEELQNLRKTIRGSESLLTGTDVIQNKVVAGVEMDRLYTMLDNCDNMNYGIYVEGDISLGMELIE